MGKRKEKAVEKLVDLLADAASVLVGHIWMIYIEECDSYFSKTYDHPNGCYVYTELAIDVRFDDSFASMTFLPSELLNCSKYDHKKIARADHVNWTHSMVKYIRKSRAIARLTEQKKVAA